MPDAGGQRPVALDQSLAGRRVGPPAARGRDCSLQAEVSCSASTPFVAARARAAHTQHAQKQIDTVVGINPMVVGGKTPAHRKKAASERRKNCPLVDETKGILWWSGENP